MFKIIIIENRLEFIKEFDCHWYAVNMKKNKQIQITNDKVIEQLEFIMQEDLYINKEQTLELLLVTYINIGEGINELIENDLENLQCENEILKSELEGNQVYSLEEVFDHINNKKEN